MSFSDLTSMTLFNTILLTCGNASVEGKTISSVPDLSDKFGNQNVDNRPTSKEFEIKLQSSGDKSSESMAYCQTIDGLTIERKHTALAAGGVGEYTAQLPALSLTYGDLTLLHVTVTDGYFLNWLLAGAEDGYVQYAQMEITVGTEAKGKVVYTVNDAFVKSWSFFSKFKLSDIKQAMVVLESVTICYGSIDVSLPTG